MKQAHVSQQKKETVSKLKDLISQYDVIGAVNMENLPSTQLQKIKQKLKNKATIFMTKRRLMKIAIADSQKKDLDKIIPCLVGMPALLFTKENPFKLYSFLSKNKSPAFAKTGQIALTDIIVKAGPTQFMPGPIIGELAQIGIKSGVESGKVAIKNDVVVAKKGEPIKPKAAEILARLGITPMEIGLDLTAVYEKGTIYNKEVLSVDESKVIADLVKADNETISLALFISYPAKNTIEKLLAKAHNDARAIGIKCEIIDEGIVEALLANAHTQMSGLSTKLNFPVIEKKVEEKTTENKVAEIVEKMKTRESIPSAEDLVEEVKKESTVEKPKKDDIPSAHELAKRKEIDQVEKLTNELRKKGSLR